MPHSLGSWELRKPVSCDTLSSLFPWKNIFRGDLWTSSEKLSRGTFGPYLMWFIRGDVWTWPGPSWATHPCLCFCVGQLSSVIPGGEAAGCSPQAPGLLGILIWKLMRAGPLSGWWVDGILHLELMLEWWPLRGMLGKCILHMGRPWIWGPESELLQVELFSAVRKFCWHLNPQ